MQERHWTPDQVDAIDVDEYTRIVAFEIVGAYERGELDQLPGGDAA